MRWAAQVREERGKRGMDRKENLRKEGIKGNSDEHCASPALASSEDYKKEKSTVRGSEVDGGQVGFTVGGTLGLCTQRPRVEGRRHCNATL